MIGRKLIESLTEGRGPRLLLFIVKTFRWGPTLVCEICPWRNVPSVCSERNLAWRQFRNSIADYQCQLGGNRVNCSDDSTVHEVPEFIGRVE